MLCAFVTVAVAPVFMPNWHSDDEHSRTHLHQKHVCNVVCVWPIGRAVVHFGVGGMHGRSMNKEPTNGGGRRVIHNKEKRNGNLL